MKNTISPLKAIRTHCKDCSGGSTKEVAICRITDCPLYIFRFGNNPNRKTVGRALNFKHQSKERYKDCPPAEIHLKPPTQQLISTKEAVSKEATQ